jgi:hypothetical protein
MSAVSKTKARVQKTVASVARKAAKADDGILARIVDTFISSYNRHLAESKRRSAKRESSASVARPKQITAQPRAKQRAKTAGARSAQHGKGKGPASRPRTA